MNRSAKRLTDAVRPDDIVGRFGGDEFIVISPGAPSADVAKALADRVSETLEFEMIHDTGFVTVGATVGPAWIDKPGTTADALVARADAAMYERKRHKKAAVVEAPTSMVYAEGLLGAAERSELDVAYSGIFDAETGVLRGAEARLLWVHDGRHMDVRPLLPEAEESGAIVPVGQWLMERLASEMAGVADQTADDFRWFIRLSDRELAANGPDRLRAALDRHDLSPTNVVALIGPSRGDGGMPSKRVAAFRLTEMGFELGLTEFASGWSSIGMVQNLPVSWLHVDHAYGVDRSDRGADEILASATSLANRLGLSTVVAGMVSHAQLDQVRHLGGTATQGPLYGPPVDILALLNRERQHAVDHGGRGQT